MHRAREPLRPGLLRARHVPERGAQRILPGAVAEPRQGASSALQPGQGAGGRQRDQRVRPLCELRQRAERLRGVPQRGCVRQEVGLLRT